MKLGLTMFATDLSIDPVTLAEAAEERGFSSLYLPEHTHIPCSRETPAPTGEDELAEEYRRTLDPFVALAAAASRTSRLRLGTGIALVAQRDPIVLAKEVATLDWLSRGRVELGIGFGWNREEMASHGVAFSRRRALVREKVLAMMCLWNEERAEYRGEMVSIEPSWSWPKPVQQPAPPILVGGAPGEKLFAHVAEYADAWIPIGGAGIREALPQLRAALEAAGREPDSVRVVPFGTIPNRGKLEYYTELGIEEIVLRLPSSPEAEVMAVLDRYVEFLA